MNKTTIIKVLNNLKNMEYDEAISTLTFELLKTEDKNNANLFSQVKSYLNKADKARPILRTIQHKNNHQFICNGYSLFVFNKYIQSLDALAQASDEQSINYLAILDSKNGSFESLTSEYKFVFENLKKYIDWCKAINLDKDNKDTFIPLDGRIFDANLLLDFVKLNTDDFDNIKYLKIVDDVDKHLKPIHLISDSMESLILPYRASEEFKNKTIDNFNNFKIQLKRVEE